MTIGICYQLAGGVVLTHGKRVGGRVKQVIQSIDVPRDPAPIDLDTNCSARPGRER